VKLAELIPGLCATALAGAIAAAAIFGTPVIAAADNSIAIPPMNQNNPAWTGARLGASPTDTIGSSGCAITAVTMMLGYYGVETDPASLNAWLTPSGGYAYWDQLVWDAVTRYSGGQVAFSGWFGPDLGLIERELDAGRPVVAEVRLSGNQHFVLLTGYTAAGGFVINDPWFGDSVRFSDRYGDPASGMVSIRTFMPADAPLGFGDRRGWLASAADALRQAQ
jgi:Peptidase_C39 like family